MSEPAVLCQYLDWDSDFFGRRIARAAAQKLERDGLVAIERWCEQQQIDCLYYLCEAGDAESIRLADEHDFRLVDIRLTLERSLDRPVEDLPEGVRLSREEDIPALRALAQANHRNTRFYQDPHFPRPLCDALYATWIEKSCRGYADAVLVAERQDQVAGYITCRRLARASGQIGLVGAKAKGQGVGQELMRAALDWFAGQGIEQVTVVTQGSNIGAQRLFQKFGFRTQAVELWYHRWFCNRPG